MTFANRILGTGLICCLITLSACTPQQKLAVVTDVQKFLPVIVNVADAVCAFTPTAPICLGAVTAVSASAGILTTALVNYYSAVASGSVPPGILAALSQAVTTFEADASNILDAVHVLNPALQTEIVALVAAAQVLLAVIESLLPTLSGVTLKFGASKPSNFSLHDYVVSYNGKVSTCQHYMPRSVTLQKIHIHSLALRILSFGIAK